METFRSVNGHSKGGKVTITSHCICNLVAGVAGSAGDASTSQHPRKCPKAIKLAICSGQTDLRCACVVDKLEIPLKPGS